ncbi:MAG: ABC transporter ATP-binding protein [Candidatus Moranbacteria bacterium]|nr:ABC transporter ATP-binding protein [Candidatus Moranbacteria bacterium]
MSKKAEKEKIEIKKVKKPNINGFWVRLWILLKPSRKQILRLFVVTFCLESMRLVGPYFLKLIIDLITTFSTAGIEIKQLLIFIVAMFLANQTTSILAYLQDRRIFRILTESEVYLYVNAFTKMVSLGLGYHEKENTGNKIIKIQRGANKINELMGNFFWDVAPSSMQLFFTVGILFFISWYFGLIVLVFATVFIYLTIAINKDVYPYRKARFGIEEEASGMMTQAIININAVKSFVQEDREINIFSKIREKIRVQVLFEFWKIIKQNLKRNFVIDSGRVLIIISGMYLIYHGMITIGTMVFVYTISEKALLSLYRISRLYDRIMESAEAVDRLYFLSLEKSDIENPANGLKPKNLRGEIEFRDVEFAYKDNALKALDKVSFKIQEDCVTALVGPSGGGKTTVVRMIYRHYDANKGEVLLDGKNIKEYDLQGFRKFLAIVPQDVEIFSASLKDNISYARPNATFQEIQAAARVANAEEFISQFADGYDTMAGERGIKLSGGQRQRIGIARAILANPRILIFDEATSNLDSQSEKLIQDAMDKISKNRTVILIAHRLSTIKKADKIIVLEKGRVIEFGSHFELAKSDGGLYQKLLQLQQVGDVD